MPDEVSVVGVEVSACVELQFSGQDPARSFVGVHKEQITACGGTGGGGGNFGAVPQGAFERELVFVAHCDAGGGVAGGRKRGIAVDDPEDGRVRAGPAAYGGSGVVVVAKVLIGLILDNHIQIARGGERKVAGLNNEGRQARAFDREEGGVDPGGVAGRGGEGAAQRIGFAVMGQPGGIRAFAADGESQFADRKRVRAAGGYPLQQRLVRADECGGEGLDEDGELGFEALGLPFPDVEGDEIGGVVFPGRGGDLPGDFAGVGVELESFGQTLGIIADRCSGGAGGVDTERDVLRADDAADIECQHGVGGEYGRGQNGGAATSSASGAGGGLAGGIAAHVEGELTAVGEVHFVAGGDATAVFDVDFGDEGGWMIGADKGEDGGGDDTVGEGAAIAVDVVPGAGEVEIEFDVVGEVNLVAVAVAFGAEDGDAGEVCGDEVAGRRGKLRGLNDNVTRGGGGEAEAERGNGGEEDGQDAVVV